MGCRDIACKFVLTQLSIPYYQMKTFAHSSFKIDLAKLIIFLSVFFCNVSANGQSDSINVFLSTPYHTVVNHLKYLQKDDFRPNLAARSFQFGQQTDSLTQNLTAIKLLRIFNGLGKYIDPDVLPRDPEYFDSLVNRHRYTPVKELPKVYLIRVKGKWLYSKETVESIDQLFSDTYPFGTSALLEFADYLSRGSSGKVYLGLQIWQYIGLLVFLIICITAHKILVFTFNKIIYRILMRLGYQKVATKFIAPVSRPISYTLVILWLILFYPALQLPIKIGQYVLLFFNALLPFFLVLIAYRLIDVIMYYLEEFAKQTDNTLDDQLVPIVRKSLKIMVVIIGTIFILQNLNFDITGLLAGISIGGLAFALAAQDTIKNLFGSLMIFVDRPFQIGDWVVATGVDGMVEEVGFRSTRIRTFHNSLLSIPNGQIANMTVDNMGLRVFRRFSTSISITYDTPSVKIEAFTEGLKRIVSNHPKTRKDFYEIHLNSFGDFSLNILFYIFFQVPTWSEELACRHEIMLEIIKLAEALEVRFAFPTSTVHIEDFPGKEGLTPIHSLTKNDLLQKLEQYPFKRE